MVNRDSFWYRFSTSATVDRIYDSYIRREEKQLKRLETELDERNQAHELSTAALRRNIERSKKLIAYYKEQRHE